MRFPRLQKRGPIEANRAVMREVARIMFPRLQKRGPIEASIREAAARARELVSTLTKAWPH